MNWTHHPVRPDTPLVDGVDPTVGDSDKVLSRWVPVEICDEEEVEGEMRSRICGVAVVTHDLVDGAVRLGHHHPEGAHG